MVGPSRPPEPPNPRVKIDASALMSGTRRRTIPRFEWKASMIASAPPPRVSGAKRESSPPAKAPTAGIIQTSQGRKGVSPRSLVIRSPDARKGTYPHQRSSTTRCTISTPAKKNDPTNPAATPTSAARSSVRPSS